MTMPLPLILALAIAIAILLWRMAYFVEWRRTEPGRHAMGHVKMLSRDDDDARTEVLPIIRDYAFDPSVGRLARAVKEWHDATSC